MIIIFNIIQDILYSNYKKFICPIIVSIYLSLSYLKIILLIILFLLILQISITNTFIIDLYIFIIIKKIFILLSSNITNNIIFISYVSNKPINILT